jgi:hypothetical protein
MAEQLTNVMVRASRKLNKGRRDARTTLFATISLIFVTVAVYGRVCGNDFTWWDDPMTIHHNPRYNPPSGQKIAQTWKEPVNGLYAPVTYSYWGALAYAAETKNADEMGIHLDARVFHTGSLALHLASVLVVFSILRLLSANVAGSWIGAMLFAVHPVQVETVAWASGAKDLLCGLLSLCAIYQYVLFAQLTGRKRWVYYTTGGIVLILAMLSKPSAMAVPVIVAALDFWVVGRDWRKVILAAGFWALLVAPLAVVARLAQGANDGAIVAIWQRPLIAADAIGFYLYKVMWPLSLAPDYARRPGIVMTMWGGAWVFLIAVVIAALAVWAWRGRVLRPWLLAGLVIFIVGVGPVLGLTPFMFQYSSTVADHYLYLSVFGLALMATWAVVRYRGRALTVGCGVALALLAIRSNLQIGYWRDDPSLWIHTMELSPSSFNAPTNLAAGLGREGAVLGMRAQVARDKGQEAEAKQMLARQRQDFRAATVLLERAITIKPDYIAARHNAFLNYLRLGENEKAVEHLEAMLAINERLPESGRTDFTTYHDVAGGLLMKLGRYERAAEHFEKVLARAPGYDLARKELEAARAKMAEARVE